jgi:hypothetical protein
MGRSGAGMRMFVPETAMPFARRRVNLRRGLNPGGSGGAFFLVRGRKAFYKYCNGFINS